LPTESDAADARVPIMRSALWRLFGYARPYLWPIAAALALASASSVGQIGLAYLMKPVMDDVVAPAQALRAASRVALPFDLGGLVPGPAVRGRGGGAHARRRGRRARAARAVSERLTRSSRSCSASCCSRR
jgi:hypothetical protein